MEFGPLKVRIFPDPCLQVKSKPVGQVGAVERMLIAAMFETMHACKGVGLAAPQVGINEQIFVVDTGKDVFVAINPKILKPSEWPKGTFHEKSAALETMDEGCLSVPRLLVPVKRPKSIFVEFTDQDNHQVRAQLKGLVARVFQHELDHLNGKLILEYLPVKERARIIQQIKDGSYIGKALDNDDGRRTKI
ncbi:MAG: peptide deformylase [Candidatus Omnitrophica bacterium]|nr:peptide deformylase [Candidatus Omnitrophota bacterium]